MASIYRRPPQSPGANFWIAFYHPSSGRLIRLPLGTNNRAHAERICQHVAFLCKAASPSAPVLPPRLQEALGVPPHGEAPAAEPDNRGEIFAHREAGSLQEEPSTMPSIYPRPADAANPVYWVALYHPLTGAQIRKSLETRNREEAERRVRRIEAFCTVVATQPVEIPAAILEAIGAKELPLMPGSFAPPPPLPAPRRCTVEEALGSLLKNMLVGNDDLYLANTLSHARALFGSEMVDRLDPRPEKPNGRRKAQPREPGISAVNLDEITSAMLADFMAAQGYTSMDTCRHYKEFIRRLFNHALESGIYLPANPHAPNPAAGLSSFVDTERDIVVLTPEEEKSLLEAIAGDWRLDAGVRIMLGTGMRLHEMLSVRPSDILFEESYLRLLKNNRRKILPVPFVEKQERRTLKRGERTIAFDADLLTFLTRHIERIRAEGFEWLVPSPTGLRWTANAFGKCLREIVLPANLDITAQHFRSTYATRRIAEGWPLRVLARQMGTSVKMLELHYGGYIPPEALKYIRRET